MFKLYLLFITCIIISCSSEIDQKIEGLWVVDTFKFKDLYYQDYLFSNTIFFDKNGNVELPSYKNNDSLIDAIAKWETVYKDSTFKLLINSDELFFSGTYNISYAEKGHVQWLRLTSDSTQIHCKRAQLIND